MHMPRILQVLAELKVAGACRIKGRRCNKGFLQSFSGLARRCRDSKSGHLGLSLLRRAPAAAETFDVHADETKAQVSLSYL